MPGQYNLPQVKQPSQPTGGPRPPSAPKPQPGLALEPEFHQVYNFWNKEQSPEANDAILKNLSPIIDNAVKTYTGNSSNAVLRSKAKKIVIDSLPNYDPTNTKLKTYVFNQLQGLKRFSLHQNQIINIPEQVQLDYVNLKKKEDELQENLGRPPSDEELADATSLSKKRIGYVRKLQLPSSEGTVLQPLMNSDSADFNDPSVAGRASKSDMTAWHSFVYDSLGDIDKVIMEHSFGLNGKSILSNQQIAQKLRVSPAAISLRKNKIQQELDKREQLRVL